MCVIVPMFVCCQVANYHMMHIAWVPAWPRAHRIPLVAESLSQFPDVATGPSNRVYLCPVLVDMYQSVFAQYG